MKQRNRFPIFLLALAFVVAPLAIAQEDSTDVAARRRALIERYKNANSPEEKRAIIDELEGIRAVSEGRSPNTPGESQKLDRLPTAAEAGRFGAPLGLSGALGLGARLASDGELSDRDVQMLVGMAARDGVTEDEKRDLREVRDIFKDRLSDETLARLNETADAAEGESTMRLNTENGTWTSSYFPMAGNGMDDEGSANRNLWANDGALAKADKIVEKRTGTAGTNLERERKSAVGFLLDEERGFFLPSGTLRENDAERTTGLDFNGNGKIDPDIAVDFLDSRGSFTGAKRGPDGEFERDENGVVQFDGDGKTDDSMGVGWWGRCNNVGAAGTIFKEPKHPVTLEGPDGEEVTFSPTEIKGLLAVFSDSIVNKGTEGVGNRFDDQPDFLVLADGTTKRGDIQNADELDFLSNDMWRATGNPRLADFMVLDEDALKERDKTIKFKDMTTGEVTEHKPEEIRLIAKEDSTQDTEAKVFHNTMIEWLADGRGGVLEMDPNSHVWNYNFESVEVKESKNRPTWAPEDSKKLKGFNGPPGDGELTFFESKVKYNGGGSTQNYKYWTEKDESGNIVNSGWESKPVDFMWRNRETEVDWTAPVPGLPDLDPALIKELYEKSTAELPQTPAPEAAPENDSSNGGSE
jgi:hypothetical protein